MVQGQLSGGYKNGRCIWEWISPPITITAAPINLSCMPTAITQKTGEDFWTPILSKLDVMLQMNATISISFSPFSFRSFLNGARYPLFLSFRFSVKVIIGAVIDKSEYPALLHTGINSHPLCELCSD